MKSGDALGFWHHDAIKTVVKLDRFALIKFETPVTDWAKSCKQDSEIVARKNTLVVAREHLMAIEPLKNDTADVKLGATFAEEIGHVEVQVA